MEYFLNHHACNFASLKSNTVPTVSLTSVFPFNTNSTNPFGIVVLAPNASLIPKVKTPAFALGL